MPGEATLHVRRHVARCRVLGTESAPLHELAAELARLDLPGPQGIWLIRRLDVHACLAPGAGSQQAARILAQAVVRQLRSTLSAGHDQPGVLWFPDRVSYVAQWIVDLCHDRAQGRWEYAELGSAPFSAAVRELAAAEPRTVHTALRGLPGAELDEALARLAPGDAAAIVHAVAAAPGGGDASAVAQCVRALLDDGRLPSDTYRATLAVVLALGEQVTAGSAGLAREVAAVAGAVRVCGYRARDDLARALVDGDWRTAARLGGPAAVTALRGWSGDDRAGMMATLVGPAGPAPAEAGHTTLGGIFLLLPLLAELPLADATEGWPVLREVSAKQVVSALSITGVLGPDRAARAIADPWLRLALGLPQLTPPDLANWGARVSAADVETLTATLGPAVARHADGLKQDQPDPTLMQPAVAADPVVGALHLASSALLRELSYRLPGMATASAAHLRRNVLDLDADVRPEADRIVVVLGRPPLNLLLSLTGMNRRSFLLPATGARPWLLTQRP